MTTKREREAARDRREFYERRLGLLEQFWDGFKEDYCGNVQWSPDRCKGEAGPYCQIFEEAQSMVCTIAWAEAAVGAVIDHLQGVNAQAMPSPSYMLNGPLVADQHDLKGLLHLRGVLKWVLGRYHVHRLASEFYDGGVKERRGG